MFHIIMTMKQILHYLEFVLSQMLEDNYILLLVYVIFVTAVQLLQ